MSVSSSVLFKDSIIADYIWLITLKAREKTWTPRSWCGAGVVHVPGSYLGRSVSRHGRGQTVLKCGIFETSLQSVPLRRGLGDSRQLAETTARRP